MNMYARIKFYFEVFRIVMIFTLCFTFVEVYDLHFHDLLYWVCLIGILLISGVIHITGRVTVDIIRVFREDEDITTVTVNGNNNTVTIDKQEK